MSKSMFASTPPKEPTIQRIGAIKNGIRFVEEGVNSSGKKFHQEFTAQFDGKNYPIKNVLDGRPDPSAANMVSVKKIDAYTLELTFTLNGKVALQSKFVVSKDGKTRTVVQMRTNDQGQTESRTVVYDKQQAG